MNLILGVDPGLHGAFALVELGTKKLVRVWDMPHIAHKEKTQIDVFALSQVIDGYCKAIKFAVVEDVSAMTYTNAKGEIRGQGAAASFAFGRNVGILHGILASNNIPMYLVRPSVWKAVMGVTSQKSTSLELASQIFPEHKSQWPLKKHDGRAEAALLAYFGAQRFK